MQVYKETKSETNTWVALFYENKFVFETVNVIHIQWADTWLIVIEN